ncbi:unnamed protein product [Polarella glacialis]|uniref:Palmitoyltransferase n=1 Tax=Polarella glacialis TaxID=89957 RepID=A0A813DQG1_POLGL|nr:unnamed protein product [Polarella glacialis]
MYSSAGSELGLQGARSVQSLPYPHMSSSHVPQGAYKSWPLPAGTSSSSSFQPQSQFSFVPPTSSSSEAAPPQLPLISHEASAAKLSRSGSHRASGGKNPGDCEPGMEDECADEKCGDDVSTPNKASWQSQVQPFLPLLLFVSTLAGALHVIVFLLPLVNGSSYAMAAFIGFVVLDTVTLGCMAYNALCDPGQTETQGLNRAHKTWLYPAPIRRYDHYCKWLGNSIGLLNHREFMIMCSGLVAIGICGGIFDIVMLLQLSDNVVGLVEKVLFSLHFWYSLGLAMRAFWIVRLHAGLVARNELAKEWNDNRFYTAVSAKTGESTPMDELDSDEADELFEEATYDEKLNPYDKGWEVNCTNFWCLPRWSKEQSGDF